LEFVILDELVEIDREKLKGYAHMVAESEAIPNSHYIPLVFQVIIPQHLEDLDLYLTLLVQFVGDL
jgi:hypothetical protein